MFSKEDVNLTDPVEDGIPAWMQERSVSLWLDNSMAHDAICKTFENILGRIREDEELISACIKTLNEMPTIDQDLFMYKPPGEGEHLNIGKNFELIYKKLKELEEQAHPAPRTDHGKRLTALEDKLGGV